MISKRIKRFFPRARDFIVIAVGISFSLVLAYAKPNPAEIPLKLTWATEKGEPYTVHWETTSQWVWTPIDPLSRVRTPVLRTWVVVPKKYKVETVDIEPSSFLQVTRGVGDYPNGGPQTRGEVIAVDLKGAPPAGIATFFLKDGLTQSHYKIALRLEVAPQETTTLLDPVCEDLQISLIKRSGNSRIFYLAASCEDASDSVIVNLILSHDGVFRSEYFTSPAEHPFPKVNRYILSKPKEGTSYPLSFGSFEVADEQNNISKYVAYFKPRGGTNPFHFGYGAGVTFVTYNEQVSASSGLTPVTMSQFGITGKIRADYQLVPNLITLDGSAYLTLLPLLPTTTPAGLGGANFYGVNGRVGYRIPSGLGSTQWSFFGGWYLWGMLVNNAAYGLQALNGPQLFISTRTQRSGYRTWSLYFKFAPLLSGGGLNFPSRELALGGSYQLNSPFATRDWILTLDVSNTELAGSTSVSLYSYSLGVQTSF